MSETHKIAAILVADVFSYSRLAGCTVLMQALSYGSSSGSRTSTSLRKRHFMLSVLQEHAKLPALQPGSEPV